MLIFGRHCEMLLATVCVLRRNCESFLACAQRGNQLKSNPINFELNKGDETIEYRNLNTSEPCEPAHIEMGCSSFIHTYLYFPAWIMIYFSVWTLKWFAIYNSKLSFERFAFVLINMRHTTEHTFIVGLFIHLCIKHTYVICQHINICVWKAALWHWHSHLPPPHPISSWVASSLSCFSHIPLLWLGYAASVWLVLNIPFYYYWKLLRHK